MDKNDILVYGGVIFALFLVIDFFAGAFRNNVETWRDRIYPAMGFAGHLFLAAPFVAIVTSFAFDYIFPNTTNIWASTPFWLAFPLLLLTTETLQYALHRSAHTWPWLWKLHRTHHTAPAMNVSVSYRYNVWWTLLLPMNWCGSIALHLGLTDAFVAAAFVTMVQAFLTHTAFRWDDELRKLPGMNTVMNVVEKFIVLPDTHHAHHGLGRNSHMVGNYAVTFFFLDVIFGSARFPHARQDRFGLPQKFHWRHELFWPLFGPEVRRRKERAASPAAD